MSARQRRWLTATAVCVVVSLASGGLAGCARDGTQTKGDGTAAQSEEAGKPGAPVTGANGKLPTLGEYLTQNNIAETPVKPDDPAAPVISMPALPDWKPAGPATPPYAFAALIDTDPKTAADPPTIVLLFSKLGNNADPAEILKLAPNELRNLPGFKGDKDPIMSKFAGFDSVLFGGSYVRDDVTRLIGQRTVVIPAKDGLYVLQINSDARREDIAPILAATNAIDRRVTIKTRE